LLISKSPSLILPLLQSIPVIADPSPLAIVSALIHFDATLLPRLGARLSASVERNIKDFPVCLVSQFISASPPLQTALLDGLDDWLLGHRTFSIGDVRQFFVTFPDLWTRRISFHLILHTDSFTDQDLSWLTFLPAQDFTIEFSEVDQLVDRFLHAPVSLSSTSLGFGSRKRIVSDAAALAFLLLRVLARVHPVRLPPDVVTAVSRLAGDAHEWVSAAAAQTMLVWLVMCDLKVPSSLVYKAAARAADDSMDERYRALFRAVVKALSVQYQKAVSILLNDAELVFQSSDVQLVAAAQWRFPEIDAVLARVVDMVVPAMQDSLTVLGCVVKLLGANAE
jgi:hypothetical protein